MNITRLALRNPAATYLLLGLSIVLGLIAYRGLPREAAPDIQIPMLIVTVPFPGASPQDVERLVVNRLEFELQNVDGLKTIKSTAAEGVANITLEFQIGFNVDIVRTKVREKINETLPELPAEIEDVLIAEINLSETPILFVSLSGQVGAQRLRQVAEDLQDDLKTIRGVLDVTLTGGLQREIKVLVDPHKLRHHGLDIGQVSNAVAKENGNIPGGSIDLGATKFLIRVPAEFKTPEEINDVVIAAPNGAPVYVRDVARTVDGFKDITSYSRYNGTESVALAVRKRAGENLLRIRQDVFKAVDGYKADYGGEITFNYLNDSGTFVSQFLSDLENNVYTGFAFVFVALVLAMGVRISLFVATAIPLSFLMGVVVMQWMGFTLNIVVMFSLILALGMLVDDAIVIVENIYRHMQAGKSRVEAALVGTNEVAGPVVSSMFTTLAAFVPLLFMPGIPGQFMGFLPKTLIIVQVTSLIVAFVISPVLVATLTGKKIAKVDDEINEISVITRTPFMRRYRKLLEWHMRHRGLTIAATLGAFVLTFVVYGAFTAPRKGVEFFPTTEPQSATVKVETPVGTTIDVTDQYVRTVEQQVGAYQSSIKSALSAVGQYRGFSGGGEGSSATSHLSYVEMEFPSWENWDKRPSEVIAGLRDAFADVAGAEVRVEQSKMGPPTGPPVNVEIRGEDFEQLLVLADQIKQRIQNIPGLVNLSDDFDRSRPELRVEIDREVTARAGLTATQVAQAIRTAFNGAEVSKFREGKDEYDIIVRLDEPFRKSPADLERFFMNAATGGQVNMATLARVDTGPARGAIRHVKLDRVLTVSADTAPNFPGPVVLAAVQKELTGVKLPPGYSLSYTGENEEKEETQTFLGNAFLIAVGIIFLVLVLQFNSISSPLIIMSTVVLSLMGVLLGLIVHDRPFTIIMTGIGVVSLAGIVVKNGIVLIEFIEQLRARGFARTEAVILGSMVRLRPVILTAGATVVGLVPIAMGMDINFYRWPIVVFGAESGSFWVAMSLALIYGLSVATLLTLIVVPTLYDSVEAGKERIAGWFGRKVEAPRVNAPQPEPERMKVPA